MKRVVVVPLLMSLFALGACSEKAQSLDQAKKWDAPAFSGAAKAYTAAGWTSGDKTSWEQQMRTRNQRQNDYSR